MKETKTLGKLSSKLLQVMKKNNRLIFSVSEAERILDKPKQKTEPRDIYDLWYLLKSGRLNLSKIKELFKKRYGFLLLSEAVESGIKSDLYRRRWRERLANQIHKLPDIDVVVTEIEENLREKL